jgi:integrase
MLTLLDASTMHPVTRLATRFTAVTNMRPESVAELERHELSLDGQEPPVWNAPAEKMKGSRPFIVPLCPQAVEVIKAIKPLTGKGKYVFPSSRSSQRPMSENAMLYAINRIGYGGIRCPHGWRSSFSTVMNTLYPADRLSLRG